MAECTEPKTLSNQFIKFCNFGNHGKDQKKRLTDKNLTKMFKDCNLYSKHLTTADTDIAFNKVKDKGQKEITLPQLKELLKELSTKYAMDNSTTTEAAFEAMVEQIVSHDPAFHGTTSAVKAPVLDRVTDHTKYTGSHKERFDESGKGKGLEGREEILAKDGYVQGYKHKGTYDTKLE